MFLLRLTEYPFGVHCKSFETIENVLYVTHRGGRTEQFVIYDKKVKVETFKN